VDAVHVASLDSPPFQRYGFPSLNYGVSPAAGADFTQEVGGTYFARLVTVFCRLVTSGDVADRSVVVEYRDQDSNRYALAGASTTAPASTTIDYAFNVFQPEVVYPVDSTILVPLPPVVLNPTDDFRIHVVGVQAADQLSRIRFKWELFYSNAPVPG
jgi:hypothetical protein